MAKRYGQDFIFWGQDYEPGSLSPRGYGADYRGRVPGTRRGGYSDSGRGSDGRHGDRYGADYTGRPAAAGGWSYAADYSRRRLRRSEAFEREMPDHLPGGWREPGRGARPPVRGYDRGW